MGRTNMNRQQIKTSWAKLVKKQKRVESKKKASRKAATSRLG